jgi:hypothetical protein
MRCDVPSPRSAEALSSDMPAKCFRGNLKRCAGCDKAWPLTAPYWHRRPGRPLGFSSRCRECRNAAVLEWRQAHPDYRPDPLRLAASLRRRADKLELSAATKVPVAPPDADVHATVRDLNLERST